MQKIVFLLVFVLFGLFPKPSLCQNTADSLHSLLKQSDGIRKGELNIELANHFLQETDSSLYYSRLALSIGKDLKNAKLIIRAWAKIGEAYQKQNKIKEAMTAYFNALKLAEAHNEKSLAGTVYNGIAVCYFYQNNAKKAEQYLKLAGQAKKDANDYRYYAIISINLAGLQISNESVGEAVKTLKDAEKILRHNKQPEYLATVYNSLGAAYQTTKPDSCVYYYEKSFDLASKHKDYLNMMTACQNLGDYKFSQQKYPEAIAYMKKAIIINESRPEDQFKPALYDRISLLYEATGDFKNAYKYRKLENETRQKLFSAEKQKEIEELDVKYQTEKKEKTIQHSLQEIERGKNQRNLLLLSAFSLFAIGGLAVYFMFQRRRAAQEFEHEKLRLFENIVHEIRTPLTLIEGPVQLMKQNPEADMREQLRLIERNSKKLTRLVDELLDASKLGKGSFQLEYSNGNIGGFIDEIVYGFIPEAEKAAISLTAENDIDGYWNFASNGLEKILSNLIANAIKYCPEGASVRVLSSIEAGNLIVEISDNGPGIPNDEKHKIFQRFFRGKYTAGKNGTGIGLSMVREFVGLMNGNIHFKSDATGTVFTVSIPVTQQISVDTVTGETNDIPTLLLAEDDPDTATFTKTVLKDGFRIIHAQNGREALEIIRVELPDIVLTDIMMPEKDGIELISDIRNDELTNHLPVVLFSARASLQSRLEALGHGADAYIPKPFSPEELRLTVKNLYETVRRNKETYQPAARLQRNFEERIKAESPYVAKVIENIIANIDDPDYSVNELSTDMAVSRSQLHRKLTALTGFSTTNFIRMVRVEKAKDLLLANEGNISEIAYKCGFSSPSYFTKSFTEYVGVSPSQFSKNQSL